MLLDAATVGLALKDAADIWSLADLTLYDLCQEHWGHSDLLAGCGRKGSGTRWEMLGNRKDHRNGSFAGADRGFWPLRAGC